MITALLVLASLAVPGAGDSVYGVVRMHGIPVEYLISLGRFAWDLLRLRWVHAA